MKFKVLYTEGIENRKLEYLADEYSFNSFPYETNIDFDLMVNKLYLTVVGNKIIQITGFSPYGAWVKAGYSPPKYKMGELKVIDNLEPGFSYQVNKVDWPIHVNVKNGWICIGDCRGNGEVVEFINDCVAVVENGELIALWLKPESLPVL